MSDAVAALDVSPVVRGDVENFDGRMLRGWASDGALKPLRLRIVANGVGIGEILADEPREDLVAAGVAQVGGGFSIHIPAALFAKEPCLIEIFNCDDDVEIPGSPVQLEASSSEASSAEAVAPKEPIFATPFDRVASFRGDGAGSAVRGHIDGFDGSLLNGWASSTDRNSRSGCASSPTASGIAKSWPTASATT